ncbi:acyltransferase family protein [Rhodococcoides fascians]|uniref:acyltransferase family protein n=1 Tax=Rhodococcoides fascians TaxID=1828 RepID=UPI002ACD53BC|nr:acyltransferase family protein [Rhodococcus fascians]WQH27758.1 acyltransferase family protein [Rhodococcus fascians]
MTSVTRVNRSSTATTSARLDIQGLRMVAVILVVLSHLFGWPRGGFIGVDVFFVISGFLITGSLLHTYEKTGTISFTDFYRRRIRRIVPAATLVLIATVAAAYFIVNAARAKSILTDSLYAFFFASNWRFAIEGTDYFSADAAVSPLQHYWSLSVEEQFYFVWPLVMLALAAAVTARAGSRRARLIASASFMGLAVAVSFTYSVVNTAENPTWAYFSTFARVWELGVGALLAITITNLERIPHLLRPVLAWAGLGAIVVGAFAITEDGGGFPAPWAAVPVLGAALVIAAGVGGDHRYLQLLTNRVSTYIGDISYSLYLWHWPVIILLGLLIEPGVYYYVAALGIMFSLAVLGYTFYEDPIRKSNWLSTPNEVIERKMLSLSRWRLTSIPKMPYEKQVAGTGGLALFTVGLSAYALFPHVVVAPPAALSPIADSSTEVAGPAQAALTDEIRNAIRVDSWPELAPSMDSVIAGPQVPEFASACGGTAIPDQSECTWGSPDAPRKIVVVGDSVALTYLAPLRVFAEGSGGQWQVQSQAMFGCTFVDYAIGNSDQSLVDACPTRKAHAINVINEQRPELVVITNTYEPRTQIGQPKSLSPNEWTAGMERMISQFDDNVGRVALLSPPPADIDIGDCYTPNSVPAECIGNVTKQWTDIAGAEEKLAASHGGLFVDSRPWFCADGYCPSFVSETPTKMDKVHMAPAFGDKIAAAFAETLAGLLLTP